MGESHIHWSEIDSYNRLMKLDLSPDECELIMMMSKEYLNYKALATENRSIKSPFMPEVTQEDLINRFKHFEKVSGTEVD